MIEKPLHKKVQQLHKKKKWNFSNLYFEDLSLTSYELLFIARVNNYFLHTNYGLLLIAHVTN